MTPPFSSSRRAGLCAVLLSLAGCSTALPEGITAVTPFEVQRYAGTWFEIARLDHSFERGLDNVSARYTLLPNGNLQVINRGFNREKNVWKEAEGLAKFTGDPHTASLKVSFFGPFYGDYWVLDHADDYSWSIVGEPSGRYLWLLAREARPDPATRSTLEARAKELGYDWSLVRLTKH